jgi:hypothetical protein
MIKIYKDVALTNGNIIFCKWAENQRSKTCYDFDFIIDTFSSPSKNMRNQSYGKKSFDEYYKEIGVNDLSGALKKELFQLLLEEQI